MKFNIQHIILLSSVWLVLVCGCGLMRSKQQAEVKPTAIDKEKAGLLNRIDRKYTDAKSHYKLGQIYHAEGLLAQAETEYNATLNISPNYRPAQAAMVKVLVDAEDTLKSEIIAEIYMNQTSDSALGSLNLALAFQKVALDDYALSCYQQALRLAPNSARINKQIGYYYLSKNELVRSQEYLSRSFQLDPTDAEVAGELGRLGVAIRVPRTPAQNAKKLDKAVDKSREK